MNYICGNTGISEEGISKNYRPGSGVEQVTVFIILSGKFHCDLSLRQDSGGCTTTAATMKLLLD